MYYQVQISKHKVKWMAIRGTSKLEGYHKHLNRLLTCGNITPELAGALICHFNGRWNIDRGVENKGETDYGMYDHRCVLPLIYSCKHWMCSACNSVLMLHCSVVLCVCIFTYKTSCCNHASHSKLHTYGQHFGMHEGMSPDSCTQHPVALADLEHTV